MRVLHVLGTVSAVHGGPSQVLRVVTESLASEGVEVEVVTTDDAGQGRRLVPLGVPIVEGAVTYRYFPRQTRIYHASLPLARWVWKRVGDYDLVHVHALFSFASVTAAFAARHRRVPYIVRPLGVLNQWGRMNRRRHLKRLSLRFVDRPVLRHAAAIQWTTPSERDQAADLAPRVAGVIIPNPVPRRSEHSYDPTALPGSWGLAVDMPVVLFLGRIHPVKALDVLIDAFVTIRSEVPLTRLVIAGDGPVVLVDTLKDQARRAGVDSSIVWTGRVDGAAKDALLERATVFVLPSRSENFGVAAVEAMAFGKPVVVTDGVGIHSDIVSSGSGIVVRCEAGALAAAVITYLTEPAAQAMAGRHAQVTVETRYAPTAVARQLLALYSDVVGGKRPSSTYAAG